MGKKWMVEINCDEFGHDMVKSTLADSFGLFDLLMENPRANWIWGFPPHVRHVLIAFGDHPTWLVKKCPDELDRKEELKSQLAIHPDFDDWIQIDKARWHDPEYLEMLAVECWERVVLLPPTEDS